MENLLPGGIICLFFYVFFMLRYPEELWEAHTFKFGNTFLSLIIWPYMLFAMWTLVKLVGMLPK